MDVSGDQAGEMRHVDEERGAAVVRDRAEPFEIDRARICRPTGDDQLRSVRRRQAFDLAVVDEAVLAAHAVMLRVEPFTRKVGGGPVTEMSARGQIHAEQCLPLVELAPARRRGWPDSPNAVARWRRYSRTTGRRDPRPVSRWRRRSLRRRDSAVPDSPRWSCW